MQYVSWDWQDKTVKEEMKNVSKSELQSLIDEWTVGRHAERDRAILKRKLIDGITYEALADEFCISVRQAKNIVYKRQENIFKHE